MQASNGWSGDTKNKNLQNQLIPNQRNNPPTLATTKHTCRNSSRPQEEVFPYPTIQDLSKTNSRECNPLRMKIRRSTVVLCRHREQHQVWSFTHNARPKVYCINQFPNGMNPPVTLIFLRLIPTSADKNVSHYFLTLLHFCLPPKNAAVWNLIISSWPNCFTKPVRTQSCLSRKKKCWLVRTRTAKPNS